MKKRTERRERTQSRLREPEFMDFLCEEIAEGATLAEITHKEDLKYKIIYDWIVGDEERRGRYENALQARGNFMKDTVLTQIRQAATATLMDALDSDGEPLPPGKMPDAIRPAIAGYEITTDARTGNVSKKIKLVDKTRNAELLGKTQAMFTEKVDLGGKMTLEQLVTASMNGDDPDV